MSTGKRLTSEPNACGPFADGKRHLPPDPARRLPLVKKLGFSLLATTLVLGLIELTLSIAGVRPYRDIRDPLLDFAPSSPLFTRIGDEFRTTEARLTYFNPQRFAAKKPDAGVRVFCLGGSTTFGHPYDDRTSYVGWLRALMQECDRTRQWEVINCGGVSYASYRLAHVMEELLAYEPDVFVIHAGQNEFLEDLSYQPLKQAGWWQSLAVGSASRLRTTTLIDRLVSGSRGAHQGSGKLVPSEVDAILDHTAGPESYQRDDEHARLIGEHFRFNLARMCRIARSAGAQVILIKPGSNLRDFGPFKSEFGRAQFGAQLQIELQLREAEALLDADDAVGALKLLEQAFASDPRHARTAYLAGTAAFRCGAMEQAAQYFRAACDEDVCPLRPTSALLEAIDDVGRAEQVTVLDFSAAVSRESERVTGCSAPGAECFLDHVHPTIALHLELAKELARILERLNVVKLGDALELAAADVHSRIMPTIDQDEHALALSNVSQVLSWAGLTAEPLRLAEQAAELSPQNTEVLAQLGRMYDKAGQLDRSRETYVRALQADPTNPLVTYRLGRTWMAEGEFARAAELLELSLEHTPQRAPRAHRIRLFESLEFCYKQLGRHAESEDMRRRAQTQ